MTPRAVGYVAGAQVLRRLRRTAAVDSDGDGINLIGAILAGDAHHRAPPKCLMSPQ